MKPWVTVLLLAGLVGMVSFGIHWYRFRFVRTDADLFRLLPEGDATVFFADVAALRRAGTWRVLAGVQDKQDREYKNFVRETQFDYWQDLNQMAGELLGDRLLLAVRGHFDEARLHQYATKQDGTCVRGICSIPSSTPGRWVSFSAIQPDVLALAIAADPTAARSLAPGHSIPDPLPSQAVWLRVSQSLLKRPADLPAALRIFAISMESANPVVLSLSPAARNSGDAFNIRLDAGCPSEATAATVRNQLEIQTNMLKLELAREHERPNPADLSGLLTSGSFQVLGKTAVGTWHVSKQLLSALQ